MHLLDPRNGPDFDLPPCPGARTYVIASTPRSGSTLLARALWAHRGLGAPKEYLNPMQIRDWEVRLGGPLSRRVCSLLRGPSAAALAWAPLGEAWLSEHLARVRARRSSGGWFGLKLHWHHHQRFFATRPLERWLGPTVFVRIRRDDRLAQAVSWELARQTHRWVHEQRPLLPPTYRRDALTARLAALDAAEAGWDERLAGERVIEVRYEALVDDWAGELGRVAGALGVRVAAPPPPSLRRMAADLNASWAARYREEVGAAAVTSS